MMKGFSFVIVVIFVVTNLCGLGGAAGAGAQDPAAVTTLAVAGRANATPWVAVRGQFVAVVWGATAAGKTDVFVATSRDEGRTFATPVRVNARVGEAQLGGERTPRVGLAATGPAAVPEIVVLWTATTPATVVRLARSRDGGRTFGAPKDLQGSGAAGNRGWASLAVDAGGVAHAFWLDHRGMAAPAAGAHVMPEGHDASHSAGEGTGGNAAPHDGVAMAQRSGLYYASASSDAQPAREILKGVCYCCKTTVATGPGGIVAAAWRHVYPGNLRDIGFTLSRDGGRSFAAQARVSEDGWAIDGCPEDGPSLVIDTIGTAHIVWPTVVGGSSPSGALFYASARDGRTFTPRQRIPTLGGPKPQHPSLVIGGGGRIAVAWDERLNGQSVAAVRTVELSGDRPITVGGVTRLGAGAPASYPVLAGTSDGVIAVWTSGPADSAVVRVQRIIF